MNQNNVRQLKKLLLLAGFCVGGFTILAAGLQMGEALEVGDLPARSIPAPNADPSNPEVPDIESWISLLERNSAPQSSEFGSNPSGSNPSSSSAEQQPLSLGSPSLESQNSGSQPTSTEVDRAANGDTHSDRQLLAINTGSANDPQQPVSTVAPTEIATGSWNGASFPVEDFQAYTSPFGYRQSPEGGYSTEFHYGLDMAAPEGSYVRNWWAGEVVEVSDDSNCGTSVVVESGSWTHIYCHMQGHVEEDKEGRYLIDREGGLQIWEGQPISAGARIGRVGMTGRTTGPHLHWGLKYDGSWVDPALVLRAMYSSQQTASQPRDAAQ